MDNGLRIVQGNTFATAIEIHAVDATGQPIVDWSLEDSTDLRVWYVFAGREQDITTWQIDDGKLVILWLANMQRVGTYDIFCAGKYNGADWRNAMQYQFSIVRFNHEANIPANVVILDGIYQLSAELQIITQFSGGGGGTPSQTLPLMDGEAQVGTENAYARGDHRHPSDTNKQDAIADLDNIRSGAAAGATAVQPAALSGYQPLIDNANKLDYSLLDNTPTIPAAQVQSDWNEADNTKADYIKNKPTIPSISGLESTSNKVTSLSSASTDTQYPSAKCVYEGLEGKQDTINDLSVIRSGAALGATAVQTESDPTVPSWAKQPNKPSYTAQEVGALPSTTSIPSTLAELGDDTNHRTVSDTEKTTWNNKQATLVSGTNIKTINNESLLGSGNITITSEGMVINTISLGVDNTDKLMYIYVNGEKQGTGVDVAEIVGMPRSITYTLGVNMQSSNNATSIIHGQPYLSVISSTDPDYLVDTIAVTMGGVDVSSSVVSGNTITIPKVKGDLTITVTAQFFASVDIDNAYLAIKTEQTGTLKVKLHAQPANNQSVEVNGTNLSVSPSTLTFTPSNWDTWQNVTITTGSVDDTEYGYVVITNSDPLMTETTATVEIEPMGYEDYVDTTIPTEGRHTVTAADFDTTSNYGNYIRLTGYNAAYDNIYIPATIDGKIPWCTCGDSATGAFKNNTTIKYVTFADGVIYRGGGVTSGCLADNLFEGCTSLIGVSNMNPAVTNIDSAFRGCSSFKFVDNLDELVNVTTIRTTFANSGVEYLQDISGFTSMTVAQEMFRDTTNLKKIFGFPKEMATTNVNGTNMYNGCALLEAAIVPEGVTNLNWAFGNCTSLRKVEIYEDGLTTSGVNSGSTFYNCTNLTVYCNANTTTYDTLISLFGSSTQITIKTFGGDVKPSIVVWGDSISSPNKAWIEWPARLQTKLGTSQYLVKNEALAGEWSTSTTARQGGYVMTTNAFTIPATTTPVLVTITVNGNETFSASPLFSCGMSYNPCTIDGVDGILSREGAEYFFTRKEAGTAKSVSAGTVIVSDNDTVFNNANNVMLFYLNGNAGWDNNPSKLLDMCQKAVNHFTALGGTKYIVAGLSNLFATTSVSLAEQFEALAAEAFGSHFLNLRTYEIQNGLTQNNLTASTLDVERMTEGRVPASLVGGGSDVNILMYDGVNVTDQVHPNAYGANTIMLAFYDKGVELGYWSNQS